MKVGEIIDDRYKITGALGEGGMAQVYKAKDIITEKDVAIKIIKEDTMKNPLNLTRFEREARAAASLKHQNIVQVYNLGTYESRPYMVTELVQGRTLKDALTIRGKFSFLEACDIMYQLCSAVYYAHQHGVIHRDIKPENIFIQNGKVIKIGDFGLSCKSRRKVVDKQVISLNYKPPELLLPEIYFYGPEVDIWSTAVTFYRMITNRYPFGRLVTNTKDEQLNNMIRVFGKMNILKEFYTPLNKKRIDQLSGSSSTFNNLFQYEFFNKYPKITLQIKKMFELDPEKRPSAKELLQSGVFKNYAAKPLKVEIPDNYKKPKNIHSMPIIRPKITQQ